MIKGHGGILGCDGPVLHLDCGGNYMIICLLKLNNCTLQKCKKLHKLYLKTTPKKKDIMALAMYFK